MSRAPDWDIRGRDVPRKVFPRGRVRFSLGTSSKRELARRHEVLNALRESHEWDIIAAIRDGLITLPEVVRRVLQGGKDAIPELRSDVHGKRVGGVLTLAQEAEAYLEWYDRKRRPQSVKQVRSRLKRVLEQLVDGVHIGGLRVGELSGPQLERAIEQVSTAPGTVHGLLAAVSGLYSHIIEREAEEARTQGRAPRWSVNPASRLERPDRDARRQRPRTLATDEIHELLARAELYQLAYLRSFLHLGLRLRELIHTRRHLDLDVERWEWIIQPRSACAECGCIDCRAKGWAPKTKRGHRSFGVPAGPPLREAIQAYLEAFPCGPGDFAFRNPRTGRVWDELSLQKDFAELCGLAGVTYGRGKGVTLHTLRHTCATNLVLAGVPESVIAALLGDTVDVIVQTYVHLRKSDLADAIRRGPAYA